jgi:D-glycero-alpha-D-manno-heptose-7-phosphate kinase
MKTFTVTAPTRADLAGGTLDLWPLYCVTGPSRTINVALDLVATLHFELLPADVFSLELENPTGGSFVMRKLLPFASAAQIDPAFRFPAAMLSEYLSQLSELPRGRLRIRWETQAPLGSGLGGSSTLCVALIRGISFFFKEYFEQGWQWRMLNWVRDAEAAFLRTPTGMQDYLAALFGGFNAFTFETGKLECVPYPTDLFDQLSERLVVLFSGEQHHSGMSNWEIFKAAMDGDARILSGLSAIRDITDHLDGELRSGNASWSHIGSYLNEEWKVRKEAFRVNTPRLDEITEFLRQRKVLGAKVCGAAQGGSLIALIEPGAREALKAECEARGIRVLATRPTRKGVTVV